MYSVLLADDSEDDRMLFQLALRRVPGMHLAGVVVDGEQTIAYLAGRNQFADRRKFPYPDLLFLDLKMPRTTGFEVLEWLKTMESKPFIVVFSGSELETDIKRALSLGADTYQVKPANCEAYVQILTTVQELMLNRQEEAD